MMALLRNANWLQLAYELRTISPEYDENQIAAIKELLVLA